MNQERERASAYPTKLVILIWLLYLFIANTTNMDAEPLQLYEDPATGQVFTRPGPGRQKISEDSLKQENEIKKPSHRKLKLTGRAQVRTVAGQKDSVYSNGHNDYNAWDTGFRRLRLGMVYQGDKWWGATVDLKMENLLPSSYTTTSTTSVPGSDGNDYTVVKSAKTNNGRGGVQEANIWLKAPFLNSKFYFGQHRLRFLREELETSANLLTTERAFSITFLQQWEIGGFADIYPLAAIDKKYTYFLKLSGAITNGKGSSHEGRGRQRVLTDTRSGTEPLLISPMYSWRIEINPFDGLVKNGKMSGWKEGMEIFQRKLKVSIGMAGVSTQELKYADSFNPNTRGVSKIDTTTEQTTATGGDYDLPHTSPYNLDSVLAMAFDNGKTNFFRPAFGLNAHTYDITATWRGLYVNGAYSYFSGSAAKDSKTYHATLGYIHPIKSYHIMPVLRYDYLRGDFDKNFQTDSSEIFKAYWIGVNFFGRKHDFKVQLFYNILNDRLRTNYLTQKKENADNNLIYFQVQVTFGEQVALK